MAESSNASSPIVQEGVNGHVSQLPNGHVSQLSNGDVSQLPNGHVSQLSNTHVSQLPNGHTAHLPNEHVSQSPRERLVAMLYREVSADMRKVDQYHRMSRDHWRSVRRLGVSIAELWIWTIAEDMVMRLWIVERLRWRMWRSGVNLLLEAALKYVGVCGFLGAIEVSRLILAVISSFWTLVYSRKCSFHSRKCGFNLYRNRDIIRDLEKQRDELSQEKLEDENVSLDFKVQSLIKERDNAKMEYKKLFDSIKKTQSQTQKEMDELIAHVSEKTYAYGAIRAENQNLLVTHICEVEI
ncbi:hypothetical protein Tco_0639061 [Tanacetum coccineum]